ncbi:MAG: iron-containing alcohol dehydrogenase [Pseudomonadota bacterium]|nr:iron-containing alcohol dehydrogenase [Pseudomonadota bacterium]
MTPFSFLTATEIRFGRGTADGAAQAAAGMGARALLVHGATAARADWLAAAVEAAGLSVARFACPGEPDAPLIEAGVAAARAHGAEVVLSLGGGAAIDAGKAIAALAPAARPMTDHLEVVGRGLPLEAAPLPFIALPTTAGTGAEVTKNAVILAPADRRKVSLRDPRMLPRLAIVDPALTDDLPRAVTLASGLDAVTQVIEPYLCSKANPLTDALCRDAIPRGLAALATLMAGEDRDARDALAWTSLCGGLALANSGLGAVHGLAGVIGGMAPSAPHGAVCGALLPAILAANEAALGAAASPRFAEVRGWIAGALGGAPADAPARLAGWARAQGLPGLGAMGVAEAELPAIAAASAASSSMKANPAALGEAALTDAMRAAW